MPLIDRNNGNDGAYCVFTDSNHPAGWAQNFVSGVKINLVASGHVLTAEEKAFQTANIARLRENREKELSVNKDIIALKAQDIWNSLGEVQENNPYLENKGVPPLGLKQGDEQELIVPVQNIEGEIRGLQIINEDGSKRFMAGMDKTGNFHLIAPENQDNNPQNLAQGEIIICEGYATGASLHMATDKPVIVAFDAGNLEPVAKNIREKYPNAKITICADNDHKLEAENGNNVGISKAEKAALAVGGKVKIPVMTAKDKKLGLTDFNDIHKTHGLAAVQKKLGMKIQQQQKGLAR